MSKENKYLNFITELYNLTKKNKKFGAFSTLIKKHGVDTSVSAVLQAHGWVDKVKGGYKWTGKKKPVKLDVQILEAMLKDHKRAVKTDKAFKKFRSKSPSRLEITDITNIPPSLDELSDAVSQVSTETAIIETDCYDWKSHVRQMQDKSFNDDVQSVLTDSVKTEIQNKELNMLRKRVVELEHDLKSLEMASAMNSALDKDAIDSLKSENEHLKSFDNEELDRENKKLESDLAKMQWQCVQDLSRLEGELKKSNLERDTAERAFENINKELIESNTKADNMWNSLLNANNIIDKLKAKVKTYNERGGLHRLFNRLIA